MKKNEGITLIALIITIIILVILAAVSITAVTQGNIIGWSSDAAAKYADAVEKENTTLSEFESRWASINSVLSSKLGGDGETGGSSESSGPSGGTGSSEVSGELEKYQGKYVDIGLEVNDNSNTKDDWELFYATTDKIFLIAADYVPVAKLTEWNVIGSGTTLNTNGVTSSGTYGVYWSTPKNFSSVLPDLTEVMHTRYNLESNKSKPNSIAVSHLLDKDAWNGIKNIASKKASIDYVIGGPTLEMWCAAWNEAVGANDETFKQIQPDGTGSTGYYVGCTATNQTKQTYLYMNGTTGSLDSNLSTLGSSYPLFFPHTEAVSSCYGYWLASPSAGSSSLLMRVYCNGSVNNYNFNYASYGVRPVVCLESGVSLVESAGTGKYTLSTDIRTEFLECRRTADFRAQNRVRDGQKMGEI